MKYKIYSGAFCLACLVLFSCEKELDLAPISSLTSGNFYQTEKHIEEALTAVYDRAQDFFPADVSYVTIPRSDNTPQVGLKLDDLEGNISRFNETPASPNVRQAWERGYNVISRANIVVERAEEVEFADQTKKQSLVDQARFLRAMAYFDMVRLFGDVPFITESVGLEESFTIPRTPSNQIYDFIKSEFEALSSNSALPAKDKTGVPTKFAANGLAARVYMTLGDFGKAKQHLESIINSGEYQTFDDWSDLWKDANDNGPHAIFQIQFVSSVTGEGNPLPNRWGPRNPSPVNLPFGGSDRDLFSSEDLWNAYSENDLRRDLTLQNGFISIDDGTFRDGVIWLTKFFIQNEAPAFQQWELNWTVMRYTDVLMMYAEILNQESYPNNEALDILNMVRTRAGLDAMDFTVLNSQDAFFDELLHQRRLEFAYEGLRWFDLIRTGKDMEILSEFASDEFPYSETRRLMPIPTQELDKISDNDILWQNPGY